MSSETGQATVEWIGLIALACVVLATLASFVPVIDGRSFGGFLAQRIVCAVRGHACPQRAEGQALAAAYGSRDAEWVKRHAPGLVYEPGEREVPVDFRRCRVVACARAPDDRALDGHRTESGRRVTVFTRVVHRGGRTYVEYWFYYPDSNSTVLGSDRIWRALTTGSIAGRPLAGPPYPGFHEDDWEGFEVRAGPGTPVVSRATSHGGLQWCKWAECKGRFGPSTGWTRVSRGSHSGHVPLERHVEVRRGGSGGRAGAPGRSARIRYQPQIPGVNLDERTSTPDGIRLVPLETLPGKDRYRRRAAGVSPPWEKALYEQPDGSGS